MPTPGNAKAQALSDNAKAQALDREKLKKTAREFESLLLEQMVKEMRSTVPQSHLFGKDPGREIFDEMLDGEFVRLMSERGGIGIADFMAPHMGGPKSKG
jgi:flagellar protein FlgJ